MLKVARGSWPVGVRASPPPMESLSVKLSVLDTNDVVCVPAVEEGKGGITEGEGIRGGMGG